MFSASVMIGTFGPPNVWLTIGSPLRIFDAVRDKKVSVTVHFCSYEAEMKTE